MLATRCRSLHLKLKIDRLLALKPVERTVRRLFGKSQTQQRPRQVACQLGVEGTRPVKNVRFERASFVGAFQFPD
jgi:hypothetical protein